MFSCKDSFKDKKGVNAKKASLVNGLYQKVGKHLKMNKLNPRLQKVKDL